MENKYSCWGASGERWWWWARGERAVGGQVWELLECFVDGIIKVN